MLTNPRADRVRSVRALSKRPVRERTGRFAVEGPQGVREAVRYAASRVRDVYLTTEALTRYADDIVEPARAAGLHVHEVTPEVLAAMAETDAPQGVLAVVDTATDDLGAVLDAGPRLLVLLTHVRDPGNAGTVIRGADAAGADAVLVSAASVDVHSPKVVRSTAGSLFHLPVVTGLDVTATLQRLRAQRHPHVCRRRCRHDAAPRRRPHRCRTAGSWATRRGGSTRRFATPATTWCGCRSTAGPSRSTSPWPPPSASTPRRASTPPRRRGTRRLPGSVRHMPQPFMVPDELAVNGLEYIPDGLMAAVGPDATVRFMNTRAEQITGIVAADVLGRDIREALPAAGPRGRSRGGRSPTPGTACRPAPATASGCSCCPPGASCWSPRSTCAAARVAELRAVVVGLRDAEGRRRAEAESAALLTTVAHELRSPLTGVKGFSSTLLRNWDRFTDDQKRLMLETIEADADRVTRLITELLDASRINAGRLTVHAQPLELRPRLEAQVERRVAAGAERDAFVVDVPDDLGPLWADPDRLEQVVANLVENAVRHGRGTVRLQGRRAVLGDAPAVDLIVSDDGDGIAPQHRELVFSRFWQGGAKSGTGLGLYLVRGLVEAHGGTVTAEEAPGGGALMRATFPDGD